MNLQQFQHLIAVSDSGSFSRAAEACHLTQPALSRSIAALERDLGLRLFDRVGKRSELTVAGRSVAERARRIVFEATELRAIAPRLKAGLAGAIGVGLGSGPGAALSVPLLAHFGRDHPLVRLTVSRGATPLLVQALRDRTLDVVVIDARSVAPADDLAMEPLPDMPAGFFCRTGHPLTRRRRPVPIGVLAQWPVASTPLSDDVARMLVADYGPAAHPRTLVRLCCDDVESLIQATLVSDAVFLGIAAAARPWIARRRMAAVPMTPAFGLSARFAIVTLAGRTEPPALPLLRAFVQAQMRP